MRRKKTKKHQSKCQMALIPVYQWFFKETHINELNTGNFITYVDKYSSTSTEIPTVLLQSGFPVPSGQEFFTDPICLPTTLPDLADPFFPTFLTIPETRTAAAGMTFVTSLAGG